MLTKSILILLPFISLQVGCLKKTDEINVMDGPSAAHVSNSASEEETPEQPPVEESEETTPTKEIENNKTTHTVVPYSQSKLQAILEAADQKSFNNLQVYLKKLSEFKTRHRDSDKSPSGNEIGGAVQFVYNHFSSINCLEELSCSVYKQIFDGNKTNGHSNVYFSIKPRRVANPKVIIVSAHLDSRAAGFYDATTIAPGANDDASGVSLVMELAVLASAMPWDIELIFLATNHEESLGLGAKAFAQKMKDENRDVIVMITNDIVGSSVGKDGGVFDEFPENIKKNSLYVRLFSDWNQTYSRQSKAIARFIEKEAHELLGGQVKLSLIPFIDREGRWGDHKKFLEEGIAAIRFTQAFEDYNHQHIDLQYDSVGKIVLGDVYELIEFDYLMKVLKANILAITLLSNQSDYSISQHYDRCGNGIKEASETCDHGALNGLPGQCESGCKSYLKPARELSCSSIKNISTCIGKSWLRDCQDSSKTWCFCQTKCNRMPTGSFDNCEASDMVCI